MAIPAIGEHRFTASNNTEMLWLDIVCPVPGCKSSEFGVVTPCLAGINATITNHANGRSEEQCREWLRQKYIEHVGQAH
jgi:hypothetical protein